MKTIPAPLSTLPQGTKDLAAQIAADRARLASMARFLDSQTGQLVNRLASHPTSENERLIREVRYDLSRDSLYLVPVGRLGDGCAYDLLGELERALGKKARRVATGRPGEYNWAFVIGDPDNSDGMLYGTHDPRSQDGQFLLVIEVREHQSDPNLGTNPRYMP